MECPAWASGISGFCPRTHYRQRRVLASRRANTRRLSFPAQAGGCDREREIAPLALLAFAPHGAWPDLREVNVDAGPATDVVLAAADRVTISAVCSCATQYEVVAARHPTTRRRPVWKQ